MFTSEQNAGRRHIKLATCRTLRLGPVCKSYRHVTTSPLQTDHFPQRTPRLFCQASPRQSFAASTRRRKRRHAQEGKPGRHRSPSRRMGQLRWIAAAEVEQGRLGWRSFLIVMRARRAISSRKTDDNSNFSFVEKIKDVCRRLKPFTILACFRAKSLARLELDGLLSAASA